MNDSFQKLVIMISDARKMTICFQMKNRFHVTNVALGWFIRSFKSNNHESSAEFALFCTFCQKFCHLSERAKTVVNAQIEILDVRDKGKDTIQGHFTFHHALIEGPMEAP